MYVSQCMQEKDIHHLFRTNRCVSKFSKASSHTVDDCGDITIITADMYTTKKAMVISAAAEWCSVTPTPRFYTSYTLETKCMCAMRRVSPDYDRNVTCKAIIGGHSYAMSCSMAYSNVINSLHPSTPILNMSWGIFYTVCTFFTWKNKHATEITILILWVKVTIEFLRLN